MHRAISLFVVLAHFAVVSTPCFEAESSRLQPPSVAATRATHPVPAVQVEAKAQHAHHRIEDARAHAHHGGDSSGTVREATAEIEIATDTREVAHQLRALCLCGCDKNADSPGTTSSPRLGFALMPTDAPGLTEATPPHGTTSIPPVPAPLAKVFDHVPIPS
ncbi:MAG: hypothetical protein GY733_11180 [bacterium]|nr:hypothetical protein [bacterium]